MSDPLIQRAYRHLRAKLMHAAFIPGRGLSHRTLAREMGISITPVRQAMQQLQAQGVLESRPKSGTYPRRLTTLEIENLFDLREMLEGYAAERAAMRITAGQLEAMRETCDEIERIISEVADGRFARWDGALARRCSDAELRFHGAMFEAAANSMVAKVMDDCQVLWWLVESWPGMPVDDRLHARLVEGHGHHLELLAALRLHDAAGSRQLVEYHVRAGRSYFLSDLQDARRSQRRSPQRDAVVKSKFVRSRRCRRVAKET